MIDIPGEFHAYIFKNKILTDSFNLPVNIFNNLTSFMYVTIYNVTSIT